MKIPALRLAAVAAAVLTAPAGPPEKANPPRKERADPSAGRVKELRAERIATLKEVVDVSLQLAKNARAEVGEVLEARMSLLKAELEAAEKGAERVALYKKTLDALKEYEALANTRKAAGLGSALDVLKVKARRLEVEIQLEQATAKEAEGAK